MKFLMKILNFSIRSDSIPIHASNSYQSQLSLEISLMIDHMYIFGAPRGRFDRTQQDSILRGRRCQSIRMT